VYKVAKKETVPIYKICNEVTKVLWKMKRVGKCESKSKSLPDPKTLYLRKSKTVQFETRPESSDHLQRKHPEITGSDMARKIQLCFIAVLDLHDFGLIYLTDCLGPLLGSWAMLLGGKGKKKAFSTEGKMSPRGSVNKKLRRRSRHR
jgi:hypothetical protein